MKTIFALTLKSATRDLFLIFWSLILPIGGCIVLGYLINIPEYPERITLGMMVASIFFYTFMTTCYTIMAQRKRGVYNLLKVTPMRLWKYIFSVSSAWTLIAMTCGFLVLAVNVAIFKLNIHELNIVACIPVVLIAAVSYVFFSFFISSLVETEAHLSMITNLISMPLLFLCDAFYSLDKAPAFIQIIKQVNPLQWFVNGLRFAINLEISGYLINLLLLIFTLIVALFLALRAFRYDDK